MGSDFYSYSLGEWVYLSTTTGYAIYQAKRYIETSRRGKDGTLVQDKVHNGGGIDQVDDRPLL